jgi:hypothetical protein
LSSGSEPLSFPACEPLAETLQRSDGNTVRQSFLGDLLALGELAMLHGQPRDGKSWTALEFALAVALGDYAFGVARLRAPAALPVLIIGDEDASAVVAHRLKLMLRGRGATIEPSNIYLLVGQGCDLDDRGWQTHLVDEIKRLGIRLVILDPLRSLTSAVDQGPRELQPFARFLRSLVRDTGCCVLSVHHDSKPQAGTADRRRRAQRASGGAIFSIMDAPIHVERVDGRSTLTPDGFKHCADPEPLTRRDSMRRSGSRATRPCIPNRASRCTTCARPVARKPTRRALKRRDARNAAGSDVEFDLAAIVDDGDDEIDLPITEEQVRTLIRNAVSDQVSAAVSGKATVDLASIHDDEEFDLDSLG